MHCVTPNNNKHELGWSVYYEIEIAKSKSTKFTLILSIHHSDLMQAQWHLLIARIWILDKFKHSTRSTWLKPIFFLVNCKFVTFQWLRSSDRRVDWKCNRYIPRSVELNPDDWMILWIRLRNKFCMNLIKVWHYTTSAMETCECLLTSLRVWYWFVIINDTCNTIAAKCNLTN